MAEEAGARGQGLSRAEVIKRAGRLGAVAALPTGAIGAVGTTTADAAVEAASALRALSPAEAATLEAVLERLLPSDATGPGAKEANVLRYVDWSLAGELSMFRAPYATALSALDAYATARFGAAFAALGAAQQDAILSDMEADKATGFTPGSSAVFEMIRGHALQGMFGDPAHGGNVGFVGWKLVRFPGPRLIVSAKEQTLDARPKNQLKSTYSLPLFRHTPRRT